LRISEHRARESGKTMWLVGLNPGVLEEIRASGLAECMHGEGTHDIQCAGGNRTLSNT
jgi:hypothetical protein